MGSGTAEARAREVEEESVPSDLEADAAGGSSDNASELVYGRQGQRVLEVARQDSLEKALVNHAPPSPEPLYPPDIVLLLLTPPQLRVSCCLIWFLTVRRLQRPRRR